MNNNSKNKLITYIMILLVIILIIVSILAIHKQHSTNTQENTTVSNANDVNKNASSSKKDNKNKNEKTVEKDQEKVEENRFEGLTLSNNVKVPVLYYHSIDPSEANEVILSPTKLKEELQYIKDSGFTTITISELNDYLNNGKGLPEKSILITFDDGYMDNYTNAFPILKELNMKATIFTITKGLDQGYYLSSDQLKELSDYGIDIECHTVNHLHLNELSYEEQLKELTDSKQKLESITGKKVTALAYPYGDYNQDTLNVAKAAGYTFGFTTNFNCVTKENSQLELNRIYVSSAYDMETFKSRLEKALAD